MSKILIVYSNCSLEKHDGLDKITKYVQDKVGKDIKVVALPKGCHVETLNFGVDYYTINNDEQEESDQ